MEKNSDIIRFNGNRNWALDLWNRGSVACSLITATGFLAALYCGNSLTKVIALGVLGEGVFAGVEHVAPAPKRLKGDAVKLEAVKAYLPYLPEGCGAVEDLKPVAAEELTQRWKAQERPVGLYQHLSRIAILSCLSLGIAGLGPLIQGLRPWQRGVAAVNLAALFVGVAMVKWEALKRLKGRSDKAYVRANLLRHVVANKKQLSEGIKKLIGEIVPSPYCTEGNVCLFAITRGEKSNLLITQKGSWVKATEQVN